MGLELYSLLPTWIMQVEGSNICLILDMYYGDSSYTSTLMGNTLLTSFFRLSHEGLCVHWSLQKAETITCFLSPDEVP